MKPALYYFSSIAYDFLRQRPQQLFDIWRYNYAGDISSYYVEPVRFGINRRYYALEPILASQFYYGFARHGYPELECINRFFIERMAKRYAATSRIAIACTSFWEPYLKSSCFDVVCYDYLDSLEICKEEPNYREICERHLRMLDKSHIVFVTAEKLRQEVVRLQPAKTVVLVSNGVDPHFFRDKANVVIEDYKKTKRKVAGYVGAIYDWIDVELIHHVARLTPSIDYLMVGPVSDKHLQSVNNKPQNVLYVGAKPYTQVPAYIELFDIALIPFVKSNISESTDPIKLYEYFALGKPVVATSMKQLDSYNDGVRLMIADDAVTFANAIEVLLQSDSVEHKEMRHQVAEKNSWAHKAEIMLDSIVSTL